MGLGLAFLLQIFLENSEIYYQNSQADLVTTGLNELTIYA